MSIDAEFCDNHLRRDGVACFRTHAGAAQHGDVGSPGSTFACLPLDPKWDAKQQRKRIEEWEDDSWSRQ